MPYLTEAVLEGLRLGAGVILRVKLGGDNNIKITRIHVVSLDRDGTADGLTLLAGDRLLEVEHDLLPVRACVLRGGRETSLLDALGELDVEVSDKGVADIGAVNGDLEVGSEIEILLLDSVQVDIQNLAEVTHDLISVSDINQGLDQSSALDARHLETVDIVPEVDLVLTVLLVLDGGEEERSLVGEEEAIRGQPAVTSNKDGVEHGLVEEEVAHPLRDDNINLFNAIGKRNLLKLALDQGNLVLKTVLLDDLLSAVVDLSTLNTDNLLGTCLGSEHTKNTSTAADIKNNLILEEVLILNDRLHVGLGTNFVLEHFLMDTEVRIAIEIIVLRSAVFRHGAIV